MESTTEVINQRVLKEIKSYLINWAAGKVTHESTCSLIYQAMKEAKVK